MPMQLVLCRTEGQSIAVRCFLFTVLAGSAQARLGPSNSMTTTVVAGSGCGRRQFLAAGRRYQASEAGKESDRHRQCAYRQRQLGESMTHQGPISITNSPPTPERCLTQCAVCGQVNRWMNPFYWLPDRKRHPRRSCRSARRPKNRRFHMTANT